MSRFSIFSTDTASQFDGESELLTVSEITSQIKHVLAGAFPNVGVVGEVSNLARPRSGHLYFSLKDSTATLRAVLWRNTAQRLKFDLEDGLAVRAFGAIAVYEPRGDYQLVVRSIEPEGMGALELAYRQLCDRLGAEGLFAAERKRPIPRFPFGIALVTSPTGAAVHDMLQILARRWPCARVWIVPVKVQGEGAAAEIAEGLAQANALPGAEVVITGRGGGSLEDLWPFNEELVARAIAASRLPVITGIGHEVDLTIADLVADRRALTPSEAAELCAPNLQELLSLLDNRRDRLTRSLRVSARDARARVDRLRAVIQRAGDAQIANTKTRLDRLKNRLDSALRRRLDSAKHEVATHSARLEALSPLGVLARGYSVTTRTDGLTVVRRASDVAPGELIVTRLSTARLTSRVETVEDLGDNRQ